MKLVSLISLISLLLLIAGVITGIICIIGILNGSYLEMKYIWNNMEIGQAFYDQLIAAGTNGTYAYSDITDTGNKVFKICAWCFSLGIAGVIIPPIVSIIKKHGKKLSA